MPVMILCIVLLKLKKSHQISMKTRACLKGQMMRFEKFYTDVRTELLALNMYKDSVCASTWPCVSLNPSDVLPRCLKYKYLCSLLPDSPKCSSVKVLCRRRKFELVAVVSRNKY